MKRWRSDNLTLVPASQLPFREEWHALSQKLPQGSALFVVPEDEMPIRKCMRHIARALKQRGHLIHAVASR